jgi:hypothetical protein
MLRKVFADSRRPELFVGRALPGRPIGSNTLPSLRSRLKKNLHVLSQQLVECITAIIRDRKVAKDNRFGSQAVG